ncbi:helix-turn-helix transcriptional regulator [Nocardia neocaledoniensis]|uniref:helix-turn-helix transcriptional regulator n=1 Tax=Nocardia neocaledoniensis TaxID=236511 RepID=UPI0024568005|nr:helix-turn-helix transcriptional regulator [Nocardia neocaledoniensis]
MSIGTARNSGCAARTRCDRTERTWCERRDARLTHTIDYLSGVDPAEARIRFGDADTLCGGVQSMLFVHCGMLDRETIVRRSELVLDSADGQPDAGCLWLALLALVYADRCAEAAAYCTRMLSADRRALSPRVVESLVLIRARIDAQSGRPTAAIEAMGTLVRRGVSPSLRGMALAWLVEALVQVGDLRGARCLFEDRMSSVEAVPDRAHVLAARGALHRAEGDLERSLADYLACGKMLTARNVANPAIVPWRSRAALVATALGRCDLAAALADDELAAARRWGSPGAVGRALHAVAMARRDGGSVATLERAVELLELAEARYELMGALCDLGQLHAVEGDVARSRWAVAAATELAVAAGSRPVLQRAGSVLGTLDNQHRETGLTRQERKIAGLALRGLTNKDIAEELFLTVRTVEFHLSNVYRKLGIPGRRQLAGVMNSRECA